MGYARNHIQIAIVSLRLEIYNQLTYVGLGIPGTSTSAGYFTSSGSVNQTR